MFIKFANTDGEVFDYQMSTTLDLPVNLGEVFLLDDGIIIVDRYSQQITTQLEVSSIIETLRYILQTVYPLQTGNVEVYLPRMDTNIAKQATIQSNFVSMSIKNSNPVKHINIKLVHI